VYFGPFERAVGLPNIPINRDKITATYREGFLQILLPKRQATEKLKTRVIPITGESPETTTTESED
jgi:HSP20 family molecular chaperone IbpA